MWYNYLRAEVAPACAGREWQNMFFVYIIRSCVKNWFYVGFSGDIEKRFKEHNSGQVRSTKAYKPYDLYFVQITDSHSEARDLEKFLKVNCNKESLLKLID